MYYRIRSEYHNFDIHVKTHLVYWVAFQNNQYADEIIIPVIPVNKNYQVERKYMMQTKKEVVSDNAIPSGHLARDNLESSCSFLLSPNVIHIHLRPIEEPRHILAFYTMQIYLKCIQLPVCIINTHVVPRFMKKKKKKKKYFTSYRSIEEPWHILAFYTTHIFKMYTIMYHKHSCCTLLYIKYI